MKVNKGVLMGHRKGSKLSGKMRAATIAAAEKPTEAIPDWDGGYPALHSIGTVKLSHLGKRQEKRA